MLRNAFTKLQPPLRVGAARSLFVTAPRQEKCINRVQLLGRVGRDPEQRGDVHPIITFPLATSQNVRTSTEEESSSSERSVTTWHHITVGPPMFQKYVQDFVTKGSRIIVDGSLNYYKYTTPDGTAKVSATVKASNIIILSAPRQDEMESSRSQYGTEADYHAPPETELR